MVTKVLTLCELTIAILRHACVSLVVFCVAPELHRIRSSVIGVVLKTDLGDDDVGGWRAG